nr:hypothetical protein [Burkholderia sp. MSMB1588]
MERGRLAADHVEHGRAAAALARFVLGEPQNFAADAFAEQRRQPTT